MKSWRERLLIWKDKIVIALSLRPPSRNPGVSGRNMKNKLQTFIYTNHFNRSIMLFTKPNIRYASLGLTFCNQKVSKKFWVSSIGYLFDLSSYCKQWRQLRPPNPRGDSEMADQILLNSLS